MGLNIALEILFAKMEACWLNLNMRSGCFGVDLDFRGVCILIAGSSGSMCVTS